MPCSTFCGRRLACRSDYPLSAIRYPLAMGLLSDMLHSGLQRVAEARERVPDAALRAAILGTPTPPPLRLDRARVRRDRGAEAALAVAR